MGTAPRVGQFLGDMHGHGGNFLRTDTMKDIMPGYHLTEVVELPVKSGHVLIESFFRQTAGDPDGFKLAHNKHLYVVDVQTHGVTAMWQYDGHTLGIAIYRVASKETPEEATAYKTAAEPFIDHLRDQGYTLLQIDGMIATAPRFWKRACSAWAAGNADLAVHLFKANLD